MVNHYCCCAAAAAGCCLIAAVGCACCTAVHNCTSALLLATSVRPVLLYGASMKVLARVTFGTLWHSSYKCTGSVSRALHAICGPQVHGSSLHSLPPTAE
jgi:hypothetical protein